MARGNQRDRDGERAQARASNKPKNPKDDGLAPDDQQRRERDAKAPQEKAAAKKAAQASGYGGNANAGDHTKNKKKK